MRKKMKYLAFIMGILIFTTAGNVHAHNHPYHRMKNDYLLDFHVELLKAIQLQDKSIVQLSEIVFVEFTDPRQDTILRNISFIELKNGQIIKAQEIYAIQFEAPHHLDNKFFPVLMDPGHTVGGG